MAHKNRGARRKHVPLRTCVACRQVAGKRELIRLVRTEKGVEVDETGKKAGRGAYLHQRQACWQTMLEENRLNSALRVRLSPEERAALVDYMATLPLDDEDEDGPER